MTDYPMFEDFQLSTDTLHAIRHKGFEQPTPIQALTIPLMLRDEKNIIARAQTGTGKTAAFGLPLLELIDPKNKTVRAIILVPTRELAIQVAGEIDSLKGKKKITVTPIYGGQAIEGQFQRLKKGVHIIVGTPGRVIDHLKRKTLRLEEIDHLILDEADEMLNMGFIEDIEKIMQFTNPQKRILLFSATMPQRIKELAHKYMDDYEFLTVQEEQMTTELTRQIFYEVKFSDRFSALCRIIDVSEVFYGLVFCRTKKDVDNLTKKLAQKGYRAEGLHGDISQAQRERTLDNFKKKRINILVATDVAARGIDVMNLTHVVNYSLPQDAESYVHRIGRTGRAGKEGTAVTFVSGSEHARLMNFRRVINTEIQRAKLPKTKEIIQAKKHAVEEKLQALLSLEPEAKYLQWALELLEDNEPVQVVSALLKQGFHDALTVPKYDEIHEGRPAEERSGKRGKKVRLFVALGRKDQINPKKLVALIRSKSAIKSKMISDIKVMDNFSFLTVPHDKADKIVGHFKSKGQKPLVTLAKK